MSKPRFEWCKPDRGCPKNGKLVPWSKISDNQLQSKLKYYQLLEIRNLNRSYMAADKQSEILAEAKSRGLSLKSLDIDYFRNAEVFLRQD